MKKNAKSLIAITILVAVLAIAHFVPTSAQPGDASDPLVTRRYVEERIAELRAEFSEFLGSANVNNNVNPHVPAHNIESIIPAAYIDALFSNIITYVDERMGQHFEGVPLPSGGGAEASVIPFDALFVPAGSILVAEAGVEFILRSGQATAVTGPDGMVDITAGRDLVNGETIPANHLLLVPRSDGRGIIANTDVWIMIKGGYQVVE